MTEPGRQPAARWPAPRVYSDLPGVGVDHVRLPPGGDLADFARRCRARGVHGWATVGTPGEVRAAAELGLGLWLRGLEAGGETSPFTALVLVRAAHGRGRWVVEGLGPRAMAASLAIGAWGIVVDAALFEEGTTTVRGLADGAPVRLRTGTDTPAPQCLGQARGLDVDGLLALVARHREAIAAGTPLDEDPLGCGTPIVQGPMANVAERTGLASAVAAAGAMPFGALGALAPEAAREVAEGLAALGGPWGLGVIGFEMMPHREAHLAIVRELRPDAVTLAGGTPELALRLAAEGLVPWLHTPSGRTAGQALRKGVRAIVLEGHEAGGHVGALTSVGLWEEGLAAVEAALAHPPVGPAPEGSPVGQASRLPSEGSPVGQASRPPSSSARPLVVLAGGIGDAVSAAFAAAMAAGSPARVALQVGTAFFFTEEIRGQVTTAYQEAALRCEETTLVGATVNLPLRCVPNPYTEEARALERRWLAEGLSRSERRARMEHHNLGRTRIAARGFERHPDWGRDPHAPHYREVPPGRQATDGAFTVGQGAAVTDRVATVADLVRDLTEGARAILAPDERWGPAVAVPGAPSAERAVERGPVVLRRDSAPEGAVAVVGLGCVLPDALDVPAFWDLLVRGHCAIGEVPPERWRADRYWDPDAGPTGPVATYSRLAGVVRGFSFDPLRYRIPPKAAATLDPSQRLALAAAEQAVRDAGWLEDGPDPRRAAVVLGNAMGGEFAKDLALRVRFKEVLALLEEQGVAFDADRLEARLAERLPPVEVDTMAGLLSNVIAGRVAAWLDWMGGNLTVDAACAASLGALSVAVDWLRSGRCDAVLTGGVDTDLSAESFVGFSRTRALSSGTSRPFSADADGFVMGEGCAILALERLDDALARGHRVWAVIRGVGQSSDGRGRGITAPRPEGQDLAVQRAYAEAGFSPETVGLVEAHGTGTALGDVTEVGVLRERFRGTAGTAWLGSVKSNLGHLKGAAGAAGLVKACLALATGVVPPTLAAGPVNPGLALADSPFRLPRHATRFVRPGPHRASVSAFGFGGTNFHVLLEAPPDAARPDAAARLAAHAAPHVVDPTHAAWPLPEPRAAAVPPALQQPRAAAVPQALPEPRAAAVPPALTEPRGEGVPPALPERPDPRGSPAGAPALLAFGAPTREALARAIAEGEPLPYAEAAAAPHRLALVTRDLARDRARAAGALEAGAPLGEAAHLGSGPAEVPVLLVPGQGAQRPGALASLRRFPAGAAALDHLGAALGDDLEGRGADTRALHLLLYALAVGWADVLRDADLPVAATLGHSLGEYGALVAAGRVDRHDGLALVTARGEALHACPAGAMVALDHRAEVPGLSLAAVNTPGTCVLSGPPEVVATVPGRRLDVSRAFHSPLVAPARPALEAALAGVAFGDGLPCWSAASAAPFTDPARELAEALVRPVRFADAVGALAAEGHRLFVELGPGRSLSGLVVRCAEARAVALDPTAGGDGPAKAAAALIAAGRPELAQRLAEQELVRDVPGGQAGRLPHGGAPEAGPETFLGGQAGRLPHGGAPEPRPERSLEGERWAARAAAVQDLRIAAIADPGELPRYEAARAALLRDLALADAMQASHELGGRDARPTAAPAPSEGRPDPTAGPEPVERDAGPTPVAGDVVRAAVIAAVCEVTGYPADFLDPTADLEADLGVDSIRKMEILGVLQDRLGFTVEERDYADLSEIDLDALVAYVHSRLGAPPPGACGESPTEHAEPRSFVGDEADEGGRGRGGSVRTHVADRGASSTGEISQQATGESCRALLEPARGSPVHLHALRLVPLPAAPPADLALPAPGAFRDVDGTRIWCSPADGEVAATVRAWLARPGRPERIVVLLGPGDPAGAAGAGFARSLGREWGVAVRTILADGASPERLAAEVAATGRPEAVRLDARGAWAETLLPAPPRPLDLDDPVVVATGGTTGIVRACLEGLSSRIVLLGRTPPATDLGPMAWLACDVTDPAAVTAAVSEVRARHGRIDVVVHGAGLLADAPVERLGTDAVDRVLGPKVDGARHLVAATLQDCPALYVAFGSVVARRGNPGQTLYGAANAALEALPHPTAARSLVLHWTAWSGIGMAAGLERVLRARGIVPLSPEHGAAAFRDALGHAGVVAVTASPVDADLPWPLGHAVSETCFRVPLDPADPVLRDHTVGGRPLVPAALWIRALVGALRIAAEDPGPWALGDFRVQAPTFVSVPREATVVVERDGERWSGRVEVEGAVVARAHASPCATPDTPPPAPLGAPRAAAPLYRDDVLFHGATWRVLDRYEGNGNGELRADLHPAGASPAPATGGQPTARPSEQTGPLKLPRQDWPKEPDLRGGRRRQGEAGPDAVSTALDAAHQLLSAWAGRTTGFLGLPVGAARWEIGDGPATAPIRVVTEAREAEGGVEGEVLAVDAVGRVLVRGSTVRLRRAARWPADADL